MTTIAPSAAPTDLLRIGDLGPADLAALLDAAAAMKTRPHDFARALAGQTVACCLDGCSPHARVSTQTAVFRLGGLPVAIAPEELGLDRGEAAADAARVLSSYCAAIVLRAPAQHDVERLAAAASVPVVNALTDQHQPCQALADLLTLREHFGSLRGLRLAYVGDGGSVAASLLEAGALAGMHVVVATPVAHAPSAAVAGHAELLALASGGSIELTHDAAAAVAGAHAVYTDAWGPLGDDPGGEERRRAFHAFQVDAALMRAARPQAVFMHPLPARRGEEVSALVADGPQSVVFGQAANRLPTQQAVLHALVTGDWDVV